MHRIILSLLLLSTFFNVVGQSTGEALIDAAIQYHDPGSNWGSTKLVLGFIDTRPDAEDRSATFSFDNTTGVACVSREVEGKKITWHVVNDQCNVEIDGRFDPTEEEIDKYRLTEERGLTMRNYYLYLWGLPMKLKDHGTIIAPTIYDKTFNGQPAKVAKITYDEEVGSDIWYFYFAPDTNELIGYQFFHDEQKGDGEYITLEGMLEVDGIRIPKSRSWYTNADSTLLGTDHLVHAYPAHTHK